jgi:peptidoglycan/xylan/chitin deacetylase (PgdA/CDA1 family)
MTTTRQKLRQLAYRHVGGTAVVLIYHRVTTLERDPQLLAVTPEHFDSQMHALAKGYRVIDLPDLIHACRRRSVPDRAVAVTFDDGYADNFLEATPILEHHGVPATVFACSGFLGGEREFPWDEIDRLILGDTELPETLELDVEGGRFEASFTKTARQAPGDGERTWNVTEESDDPRRVAYRDVCEFVRPLSAASRVEALRQLRAAVGANDSARTSHRPLTAAELTALDASDFVSVGSHTVNHTRLSSRPVAEQADEIGRDKTALEAILRREVTTFSYPYGGLEDYTDDSVDLVRRAGFSGACSNHPGVVKPWTDPHRIPRNLVRDWDAKTFVAHLEGWFDDPV